MTNWKPQRALLSVTDKTNLEVMAAFLIDKKIELVSSGGTAKYLQEKGFAVTPVEEIAGSPEAFGGRMKTLSFNVMGAILYDRNNANDIKQATELGLKPIDIVICNLYAFEESLTKKLTQNELVEKIDVGGPTMLRAAAKNAANVLVIPESSDYSSVIEEWKRTNTVSEKTRFELATKTFERTFLYDLAIFSKWRQANDQAPSTGQSLRYGENPHQKALVLPTQNHRSTISLATSKPIQGKQLSSNNLLDSDAAWKAMSELTWSFPNLNGVCVVKHGNPCGLAVHHEKLKTLQVAWDCDPVSAFGGILAFSFEVDEEIAAFFNDKFVEVLIAPAFSAKAREVLSSKKNLRLLEISPKAERQSEWTLRSINGGLLWQDEDELTAKEFKNVTTNQFDDQDLCLARFGVVAAKYLKSNCLALIDSVDGAIRIAASGCGQPNRLDCLTLLALPRAKAAQIDISKCVLVSDAFFPFRDSIDAAAASGVKRIVQPGGSMRDQEVIEACNEHGISMVTTGIRNFRH